MLLLHEGLPWEAQRVSRSLREVYRIPVQVRQADFDGVFTPLPQYNAFLHSDEAVDAAICQRFPDIPTLVLTPRDIFNSTQEDDWLYGYRYGSTTVSATARMQATDDRPDLEMLVDKKLYAERLKSTAIHEIGHDVIHGPHFRTAWYVDAKTGTRVDYGTHCIDNKCVMYQTISNAIPDPAVEFVMLNGRPRYDAGTDDFLARRYLQWFCHRCTKHMRIPKEYFVRIQTPAGVIRFRT